MRRIFFSKSAACFQAVVVVVVVFVRQIYTEESAQLEKLQVQAELQVSAWTRQFLITTNLSSAQLPHVLAIGEILFITEDLVFWSFCSMAHVQDKGFLPL